MNDGPEIDFIPALTALPLNKMLPFVNTLMQENTLRGISDACFKHNLKPIMSFDDPTPKDPDE